MREMHNTAEQLETKKHEIHGFQQRMREYTALYESAVAGTAEGAKEVEALQSTLAKRDCDVEDVRQQLDSTRQDLLGTALTQNQCMRLMAVLV